MFSHYIDFRYEPGGKEMAGNSPILIQNALAAVHAYNISVVKSLTGDDSLIHPQLIPEDRTGRRLGIEVVLTVSLPRFGEKDQFDCLRVFGSESHLAALVETPAVIRMRNAGLIRNPRIRETPDDHGWTVFMRNREEEKQTLAYIIRTEERYTKRNAEFVERDESFPVRNNADILLDRLKKFEKNSKRRKTSTFITMHSQHSQQKFSIFLKKGVPDTSGIPSFNSYGLATNASGIVPDFA